MFSGVDSNGYKAFSRTAETAITATATVKLDDLTRGLVHEFQQQASGTAVDTNSLTHGTVDVEDNSSRGAGRSEPQSLDDVFTNAIEEFEHSTSSSPSRLQPIVCNRRQRPQYLL